MSSVASADPSSGALITGDQAASLAGKGVGKLAKKLGMGKKKGKFFSDMASAGTKYLAPKIRGALKEVPGMKKGGKVMRMRMPKRGKSGRFMKRK